MDAFDLALTPVRRKWLEGYRPQVFFSLPKKASVEEYQSYLRDLIADFLLWLDPRNADEAEFQRMTEKHWNTKSSGIGSFYLNGYYVDHCKVYYFDGSAESAVAYHEYCPKRGILFIDHVYPFSNRIKVLTIAAEFGGFLRKSRISFTRRNAKDWTTVATLD